MTHRVRAAIIGLFLVTNFGVARVRATSESTSPLMATPLIEVGSKIVSGNHLGALLAHDAGPAKIAEIVDNFVGERIVYEYGEQNGVSITEEEMIRFIDESFGAEAYRLLAQLFGEDTVRDLIRQRLIVEKVVEQKKQELIEKNQLTVTDKEIQDYYVEHLKDMVKPEAIHFQYLVLQDEKKAAEALTALRNGGKVEELWKKYSIENSYDTNELLPKPELLKVFPANFVERLLKAPLNEWTRLNLNRYIFLVFVLEKTPPVEPKLDDVQSDIAEFLMQRKVAPLMRDWFQELRGQYRVATDVPFFRDVLFGESGIRLPRTIEESSKPSPE
ncbi:MAG: peptidyl-prolyl cis-trans isomerase [bacterium JZ-2024 1]